LRLALLLAPGSSRVLPASGAPRPGLGLGLLPGRNAAGHTRRARSDPRLGPGARRGARPAAGCRVGSELRSQLAPVLTRWSIPGQVVLGARDRRDRSLRAGFGRSPRSAPGRGLGVSGSFQLRRREPAAGAGRRSSRRDGFGAVVGPRGPTPGAARLAPR